MSARPAGGGNGGRRKRSAPLWSDLPGDLLVSVCSRLISPRDRVRFRSVCKPWRTAASLPAAPLLLLSSYGRNKAQHLCGPDESWVFRAPTSELANKRSVGSHDGGWVALLDMDDYALSIMNLFSGAEVALSEEQSDITLLCSSVEPVVSKIIFSGDPASSDGCILAAIIEGQLYITPCRVGCHDGRWTMCHGDEDLLDVAFCNGELYGLTRPSEPLIKFGIEMEGGCTLKVTDIQYLVIQRCNEEPTWSSDGNNNGYVSYIFELHGKVSMAVRAKWFPSQGRFFKVFQLIDVDDDKAYKHKWAEVTSLGDFALFIGPTQSKAVHVPVIAEHHGLERNHMYYNRYTYSWISKLPEDAVYSVTSNDGDQVKMYSKKDQSFGDGVERTGYYVQGSNYAMWVHLPDL